MDLFSPIQPLAEDILRTWGPDGLGIPSSPPGDFHLRRAVGAHQIDGIVPVAIRSEDDKAAVRRPVGVFVSPFAC